MTNNKQAIGICVGIGITKLGMVTIRVQLTSKPTTQVYLTTPAISKNTHMYNTDS